MRLTEFDKQAVTQLVETEDRQRIAFKHYREGHRGVVIIAPGFFNSKGSILLQILAANLKTTYDVIMMDFRGHGESSGLFAFTAREYLDLLAVVEYARSEYESVAVIGFSLGAATSLIAASKSDQITTVIAVSPPTAFGKIEFHFWALDFENDIWFNLTGGGVGKGIRPGNWLLTKEKPEDVVERIQCPVCYIHGSRDWLIRPWHSQRLFERTTAEKEIYIIENGPHAEYLVRKNAQETIAVIRGWLNKHLKTGKEDV